MDKKKGKTKPKPNRGTRTTFLEKLESAEAASVLKSLIGNHPELRSEAETLARAVLEEVSFLLVADEVEDAVLKFSDDDLNGRAGRHSWRYVEPGDAASELLGGAVEPFTVRDRALSFTGAGGAGARGLPGDTAWFISSAQTRPKRDSGLGAGFSRRVGRLRARNVATGSRFG